MSEAARRITANVERARQRIADAATRGGRSAAEITLVAVTKYVGVSEIEALYEAGCRDFGESRPQQLWLKAEQFQRADVRWHMIGRLQRNKARRTAARIHLLHSLDGLELVDEIAKLNLDKSLPALVEINVSGDATKHGMRPGQLEPFLFELVARRAIEVRGLMTMASREGGLNRARSEFAELRRLRDQVQGRLPAEINLAELSMGMSGDYQIAIQEGATIVRIGSALFEGLDG